MTVEEGEEAEEAKEEKNAKKEEVEETSVDETSVEIDEEIVEEKIYTIPLSKAWISPKKKRAPHATRLVKNYIHRHMKPDALIISNEVNERIWRKGIEKPPRKIRVRASKNEEGTVTLYLAESD